MPPAQVRWHDQWHQWTLHQSVVRTDVDAEVMADSPEETTCMLCGGRIVTGEKLCGACKRGTDKLIADIKKKREEDDE